MPRPQHRRPKRPSLEDLTASARGQLECRALLLDPEAVAVRAQALATRAATVEAILTWAIRSLCAQLGQECVALRQGGAIAQHRWAGIDSAIGSLREALGLSRERTVCALARFNHLPMLARRSFFELERTKELPTGKTLAPWVTTANPKQGPIDPDTIRCWLVASVHALFGREECSP